LALACGLIPPKARLILTRQRPIRPVHFQVFKKHEKNKHISIVLLLFTVLYYETGLQAGLIILKTGTGLQPYPAHIALVLGQKKPN